MQVFGDSILAIKWIKGEYMVQNINIYSVVVQLKVITSNFQEIRLTHIFREINQIAHKLAKEGLIFRINQFNIVEIFMIELK